MSECEEEILNIIRNNNPIDIHELYDKAISINDIFKYEFKYSMAHLLAHENVKLDFDGKVCLK